MKKFLCFAVLLSVLFLSCSFITEENTNKNSIPSEDDSKDEVINKISIPKEFWGTWIQMDTGDEIYINDEAVLKANTDDWSIRYQGIKWIVIQEGIDGYILESEEVIRHDNSVFFRKGGKKRGFSATISGFSASKNYNGRGIGIGSQGITGRRENEENSSDTETVTSQDGEILDFEGGVADDPQIVTVTDGVNTGEIIVTPEYDGENIGTIPVVEPGKYAFKTSFTVLNENIGFIYGNNLGTYNISINIKNIGEEICSTSVYSISWDDPNLRVRDLQTEGNFSSINPGDSKKIEGTFSYGYFDEEYKDVILKITITDSKHGQTWYDYVTLRFYRGWIDLKINALNFNQLSSAKLKGFIIYPDGRSQRFTISSRNTKVVQVPWSINDYYVVLSGANSDTEMGYSFVASEYGEPADLTATWSIDEINSCESNDKIMDAYFINDLKTPIKSYLHNGDIDYFRFNVSDLNTSKGELIYVKNYCSDHKSSYDKNGKINPGETICMDLAIYNSSDRAFNNVSVTIECYSLYLTFITDTTANYGTVGGRKYKSWYMEAAHGNSGSYNKADFYNYGTPFDFKISEDCPPNTEIPFSIIIRDEDDFEWHDTFSILCE